jgi:hypothetical protein
MSTLPSPRDQLNLPTFGWPAFTPQDHGSLPDLAGAWQRSWDLQFQALSAWQAAATAMQREWWDEWVCRWGGGVPIDA